MFSGKLLERTLNALHVLCLDRQPDTIIQLPCIQTGFQMPRDLLVCSLSNTGPPFYQHCFIIGDSVQPGPPGVFRYISSLFNQPSESGLDDVIDQTSIFQHAKQKSLDFSCMLAIRQFDRFVVEPLFRYVLQFKNVA